MRLTWHMGLGRNLGLAFWALTFFEASIGAYASIWPLWIEHLGAPITVLGLVLGASGVIRPFVLGGGSWLTDYVDTKKLLLGARLITIVGLIVAAFAQSWQLLLFTVFTNALGELVFPAIQTYVAGNAGDNPTHAFNMVITIGPASALIVTPVVAGIVIAIFGMPGAFILSAVFMAVASLFVSRMTFRDEAAFPNAPAERASYRAVWNHTDSRRIIVLHGLTILALAVGSSLIPNFLQDQRGLSPQAVSILSAGAAVGTVAYGFFSARNGRLRNSPLLGAALAAALTASGYLMFAALDVLPAIGIAYVLRGGIFSAWALFLAAMGQTSPAHLRTRAFAIVEILGGSAMSFGPVIASQLYGADPRWPFIVSSLATFAMAGVLVTSHRRSARAPRLEAVETAPGPVESL
jgi:MFS family permease